MENGPGETESQNHRIAFAKGRVKPRRGSYAPLRPDPGQ